MSRINLGNKQNAGLNGEYAKHVRADGKKITSGIRRSKSKKEIKEGLKDEEEKYIEPDESYRLTDWEDDIFEDEKRKP